MPSVAERLDPQSPHYDPAFAELRKRAYRASADHERDMASNPEYRAEFERRYGKER